MNYHRRWYDGWAWYSAISVVAFFTIMLLLAGLGVI
jgi:hypothetical protein